MTLHERCARIEMLVLDVDGVLTDGSITYSDRGEESKTFHVRDGSGLKVWTKLGKQAAIITGRRSVIVDRRAVELGIATVIQGADDKQAALAKMLVEAGLTAAQVCCIGDDLPDVPMLRACGLAIAVADAGDEAKAVADYVTRTPGGRGAVREAIEWIMRAQGIWPNDSAASRAP